MSNLRSAVRSSIERANISSEDRVVIGVSGGPDSLALLYAAGEVMHPENLWVVHLNHGLRPEADAEAAFVETTAAAGGFPFRGKKIDIASLAREKGWSVEEAGRNARYQFMAEVAADVGAKAVLVAHNSDDQAETVLHHLLRGSGLKGLQGMLAEAHLPVYAPTKLLRPFLGISRAAIEAYCREQGLAPMIDQTNRDPAYLRNRLRHELLPILAEYNPQIKEQLGQLAEISAADEAFLEEQCTLAWQQVLREKGADWLRLNRDQWRALPLSLRRRVLRKALVVMRPSLSDISFRTIDLAEKIGREKETGAEAPLPGGIILRLAYEDLLLVAVEDPVPLHLPQLPGGAAQALPVPGNIDLASGWRLSAAVVERRVSDVYGNRDPWTAYLDVGETAVLTVRTRRPGERMLPLGMDGRSAAVQDIMVNRKLPAALRDQWPLVATNEHAVWLVGHVVDERAKIMEDARRMVKISCIQEQV